MGNYLTTAERCNYCLGIRTKQSSDFGPLKIARLDQKRTEEFLTATSTPVVEAVVLVCESEVQSPVPATTPRSPQNSGSEVVNLSSELQSIAPSPPSGFRDGDEVRSPNCIVTLVALITTISLQPSCVSPIPLQQEEEEPVVEGAGMASPEVVGLDRHEDSDDDPENTPSKSLMPLSASSSRGRLSSTTPRSRSLLYRGSEATSLITSEYSLSSSAAAYFSTELGLGMPGSGASLLGAVANIKLKGWVQRNKGGYWDRWKWCFAVFISNDGSNCSRLSLWRTDRDFEDRLVNALSSCMPCDSFSFGQHGKHVVCESDWGRVLVIFDHEGNRCVKIRLAALWVGCLSFLVTALALRLSSEEAAVRSAAPPRPTWAPYKEWVFDTSVNMSMADEAEWKRLAVAPPRGGRLPIVPEIKVKDDESINANPQLKWDERSYPVGLKATPHPKVGGSSHLDEKIDKMVPRWVEYRTAYSLQPFAFDEMLSSCLFLTLLASTSCLVSVGPDKVVRDPLPLPTSTGVTQKKPMAPTIDGVRVDLGKPVDYGALIGPPRTVQADPPPPPSVFEKPDLSWSPRCHYPLACMYVISLLLILLRSVSPRTTTMMLRIARPRATGSLLEAPDDEYEDIKNHIKATRALLGPDLKHTVGYWGDWMNRFCDGRYWTVTCGQVAFKHTNMAADIRKKLAVEVKAATKMVDDLTTQAETLSKADLQPMTDLTDIERQKGEKGMMEQAEAVMKVLALLRPVVVETMTGEERNMKDVEQDIRKTVSQDKEMYDELFDADAKKYAKMAEEKGKTLLADTKKVYVNLMKSIAVLIKKVYRLQRALIVLTARHAVHSTRVLDELQRTTHLFIRRTDRADTSLSRFVTAGPERRKAIKSVISQLAEYQQNVALKRFQRRADKMADKTKREVHEAGSNAVRALKLDDKDLTGRQKKSDRIFNTRLRNLQRRRQTIVRETLRDFGVADRRFTDEAGSDAVTKFPLVNDLLRAAEHQALAVDELSGEVKGMIQGADGPHKLLGESLKQSERNMEAKIDQETASIEKDTSREAAQVNSELKDLEMTAQNSAGRERLLGMEKVRDIERQQAVIEEAEKTQLNDADTARGRSEAEINSDISLASSQA
ncbi:hypothetical protein FOL46_004218, partial [Perkinsus olseni]